MKPLDSHAMLRLSEAGQILPPWRLALLLAGEAAPELTEQAIRLLPIGERDRLILKLREAVFGDELTLALLCPRCAARLEARLPLRPWLEAVKPAAIFTWSAGESRLPNTEDLAGVLHLPANEAAQTLFRRCVGDGSPWPEPPVQQWLTAMEEHDPDADLHFDTRCESCGHRWTLPLDPATFFWKELDAVARRLIGEVHQLASRYGWSEAEILRLSPWRRRAYLECES